jgi:hypothetical protein
MNARTKVEEAARWRLEIGEPLLAGGFTWITFPRPQVSVLFLARRPHFIGVTDRRLLIWARPHEVRPVEDKDLVLDAPLHEVTLESVHSFSPMLQLRMVPSSGRQIIAEFRPRDRRLGHRIARALTEAFRADGDESTPPPESEVPAGAP